MEDICNKVKNIHTKERWIKQMKKMKLVALVGAMVMATLALAGCGKEVTCDACGQTKSGDTYEILGMEVDYCDDCYEKIEAAADLLD